MLNGCKTTRIFCRLGCPPGRRVLIRNHVVFRVPAEAKQLGYRPCLVCEPENGRPGPWLPIGVRRSGNGIRVKVETGRKIGYP
jgi:methylphosphotriester-DNA--protein-cysteine methyltransferase